MEISASVFPFAPPAGLPDARLTSQPTKESALSLSPTIIEATLASRSCAQPKQSEVSPVSAAGFPRCTPSGWQLDWLAQKHVVPSPRLQQARLQQAAAAS